MPIEKLSQGSLTEEASLPFYDPVNGVDRRANVSQLLTLLIAMWLASGEESPVVVLGGGSGVRWR